MRRNATIGSLLAIAALAVTATACSGEDAVESIFENAAESESGGEVDLDFGDDGSFSIETDEGTMTMDEDGNMVIVGEDGEVITGQIDTETGSMTIESEDGSFSFDADEDGSFSFDADEDGVTMEGDDGSFSMDTDDDGTMTFETDEGTMTIEQGEGIPDEWPSDIPRPEGLSLEPSQVSNAPDMQLLSISGNAPDGEAWFNDYSSALQSAGFSENFRLDTPDGVQASFERGNQLLSVLAASSDGGAEWGIFLSLSIMAE